MSKTILKIEDLNVSYSKKVVLKEVNAQIYEGELVSILGPSGCGKTTLLNTIAGFIKPKIGSIRFSDFSDNNDIELGFVFQNSILYDEISVYKNIYLSLINSFNQYYSTYLDSYLQTNSIDQKKYDELKFLLKESLNNQKVKKHFRLKLFLINFALFFKKNKTYFQFFKTLNNAIKNRIFDVATRLNIKDILSMKAANLSGGQRQRVAIAKSLIKDVKLILLDEPFASLDAKIKESSRDWLRKIQKEFNISMILVTHDQNDAMLISDRIMFINNNTIAQFDRPEVIYNSPINLATAKFVGFPEIIKLANSENKYIRPSKLKIEKDPNSSIRITNIQSMGAQEIIEFTSDQFVGSSKVIVNENQFQVNDQIKISFDEKNVMTLE
ncbi:ABC transporter ATP-binding protein [Mycoplasmoides gallisepticum]|uniref:ABC transporter ATP-binding protein n=1 Tax=Mycoplasmoides gallisepticum TaxID=2096 RepID=UPI002186C559|nr:ABC transporter ATP-binding protein [Mycoplasmoides gallisepticum]UQZ95708.1 ABC transporter ATP-binding protein [Mycoplasmoides gallisepticum]